MMKKKRVNFTVDPDVYREAASRFKAMDSSMSAFVEQNLAMFVQMTEPLVPLLAEVEAGTADPGKVKAAMRVFMAHGTAVVGGQIKEFGDLVVQAQQDFAEEEGT